MAILMWLTGRDGSKVLINCARINYTEESRLGTKIVFDNGLYLYVKESQEDILSYSRYWQQDAFDKFLTK